MSKVRNADWDIRSKFTYMNINLLTLNCVHAFAFLSFSFIRFVILYTLY